MKIDPYLVDGEKAFHMRDYNPDETGHVSKSQTASDAVDKNVETLSRLQDVLYAHNKYGVLIILQAMDAGGKDSIIKHIMSGLNPQGVVVTPFKTPSVEELDHDYLWRSHEHLPARGNIAIFNRSYYEDVLVVKVHNLLASENLPAALIKKDVWAMRYRQLRDYEQYMRENGIEVIKLFLHLSRKEQAKRLLERIDNPEKNWKFSAADLHERQYWSRYQDTYEEMIQETATRKAPWYIVPADHKWFARLLISEILVDRLQRLPLKYPELDEQVKSKLTEYRLQLAESDGDR